MIEFSRFARVNELKWNWTSVVRPSRRPLRGLLRMRSFLNAIKNIPHPEERPKGRVSKDAPQQFSQFLHTLLAWALVLVGISAAQSADFSAAQVRAIAAAATADKPADLSGKSLENLDLSNLDLRRANLSGANLFGAKLDGTDLSGANLSGAKLDLAWIMRANFTSADLSNASLFGLVVSSGLDISLAEAPIFKGAKFSGARIIARLSRFDLRGADFTGAKMGADMKNQSMGLMRTDLSGANLSKADFSGADLGRALLRFANLTGAKLIGANLSGADLAGADLTGADLTGANATEADFGGVVLSGVRGVDTLKGFKPSDVQPKQ